MSAKQMSEQKEKPIEKEYIEQMNAIAQVLNELFNADGKKTNGFALLVFPFEREEGRMNYISNAARADMLLAMKEFIAINEGRKYSTNTKQ